MPSDAMRADALSQYLGKKRWTRIFLAAGSDPIDQRVADGVRRSAKKFGIKIVTEKTWNYQFEDRRTPESEVPVFTQGGDYDLLVVTDGQRVFADLLAYRTWLPRPIMGSAGLSVMTWHPAHEAWGALQLQSRFRTKFGRAMAEKDYAAWLATRIVAEAGTRAHHLDAKAIRQEITSPAFAIAGFKGVPLSFRSWDRQLRQPILLADERSIVAVAPIEGYLHPVNTLDTLGQDQPESSCGKAH
jgi:ABC transporter substrate binding protein (PQQ-dependent alcohol dehydrogenase system)